MPTRVLQSEFTLGQTRFLRTDDGSAALNINGTAAGTPVPIWDGEGTYWTPGDQGSPTTESAKTGTYGWDSGSTSLGQDSKFSYGSNQDVTAYDTLSFWMQPKAYPSGSNLEVLWKTAAGTTKGNVLNVADYVTDMDLDVWQQVEIPIADFSLPDDVDRVLFKYASKGGQQFWFDDIQLNTSAGGGPYVFQVAPPDNTQRWHMSMLVIEMAGLTAGWASGAFGTVAGGLANGLLLRHRRLSTGTVLWALNSKDNVDLFGRYHPQDDISFSDDTTLIGFMVKPGKASVLITTDDVLEIVVRDNLSTITQMRAFCHYGVEAV